MELKGPTPILYVEDIEQTVRFYCDVLGFRCVNRTEGWVALEREEAEIMISLPNAHIPFKKASFTGSFYFRTNDVDSLWEELRQKTLIVYPIEPFEYGMREFALSDVNGYVLQFGQKIA